MADILKKIGEDKEKSTALEDAFKSCRFPDSLSMSLLAADIGVKEEEIEVRFKHFVVFLFDTFSEKPTLSVKSVQEISLSKLKGYLLKF